MSADTLLNAVPYVVEAAGLMILVVWTIIPIREFRQIYLRLKTPKPLRLAQDTSDEEPNEVAA